MPEPEPILLLPGLGADARMFDALRDAGISIRTPPRLDPLPHESLAAYAARFAGSVTDPPQIIGGASFGGMLALEMARHFSPRTVILLGSCTTPRRLPRSARLLARLGRALPDPLLRALIHSSIGVGRLGPMDPPSRTLLVQMIRQTPLPFIRWGMHAIMTWPGLDPASLPSAILAIHGDLDRIIRPPALPGVHIIPGAGHIFPMTHAAQVAAILQQGR